MIVEGGGLTDRFDRRLRSFWPRFTLTEGSRAMIPLPSRRFFLEGKMGSVDNKGVFSKDDVQGRQCLFSLEKT